MASSDSDSPRKLNTDNSSINRAPGKYADSSSILRDDENDEDMELLNKHFV
jgi:hypothetical protein